jgi:hypothetical protein
MYKKMNLFDSQKNKSMKIENKYQFIEILP